MIEKTRDGEEEYKVVPMRAYAFRIACMMERITGDQCFARLSGCGWVIVRYDPTGKSYLV